MRNNLQGNYSSIAVWIDSSTYTDWASSNIAYTSPGFDYVWVWWVWWPWWFREQVYWENYSIGLDVYISMLPDWKAILFVRWNRWHVWLKLSYKKLDIVSTFFWNWRWTNYTEDQVYDIINEYLIEKKNMYRIFLENLYNKKNVE